MDWQIAELNPAWRYAFMARVRRSPDHADPAAVAAGIASWNRHMAMVDAQLSRTGAYLTGDAFSLADVVVGLSVNRWFMTPIDRPSLPAVSAYYDLLGERAAYRAHGRNGTPQRWLAAGAASSGRFRPRARHAAIFIWIEDVGPAIRGLESVRVPGSSTP